MKNSFINALIGSILFVKFTLGICQTLAPIEVTYHIKEKNMQEISGLIADSLSEHGNYTFWALGDGGAPAKLYKYELRNLDSFTISQENQEDTALLLDSTTFLNASNVDWEELSHSNSHIFIGDFGNNNGNRTNLRIYRFKRAKLGSKNVSVDTLHISYSRQIDFSSQRFHPWDCEAMYWKNDSLVLLSKGLFNSKIYIYTIPDQPGHYSIEPSDSFQSTQLITGASIKLGGGSNFPDLVGYNFNSSFKLNSVFGLLQKPFKNYWTSDPSEKLREPHQLESIATPIIPLPVLQMAYATEKYDGKNARIYLHGVFGSSKQNIKQIEVSLHPNPVSSDLHLTLNTQASGRLIISDIQGKWIKNIPIEHGSHLIDVAALPKGVYLLNLYAINFAPYSQTFIKQ